MTRRKSWIPESLGLECKIFACLADASPVQSRLIILNICNISHFCSAFSSLFHGKLTSWDTCLKNWKMVFFGCFFFCPLQRKNSSIRFCAYLTEWQGKNLITAQIKQSSKCNTGYPKHCGGDHECLLRNSHVSGTKLDVFICTIFIAIL